MGTIGDLASGLTQFVKDTVKVRSIQKDDLAELLRENIKAHEQLVYILNNQSDKEMKDWVNDKVKPALMKSQCKAKNVYWDYLRLIRGAAANDERKRPLESFRKAHDEYARILQEIYNKIDKLVENRTVDIFNVRMSFLALLGILRSSDKVINFTTYLYTLMTRAESHTVNAIPRYREVYLLDKCEEVARAVTNIRDKKGPYTFLQEVDTIRKKNADLVLGATGKFDFTNVFVGANYTGTFLDQVLNALSCLNIFGAALDAWEDYKMAKYERNKETKEWLENHVALLKMDLEEMDKTSPEYMKMVAVIKAYDDKIAEYDKDILAFEQEG